MAENEVKTITIPIDEYFDLREKAHMNMYLMERLGNFEGEIREANRRIYELECKMNKIVTEN